MPFVEGGAELHVKSLIDQLRTRGYDVEKVALPFRVQPVEILAQAAAWRLLDLSSTNLSPVDLLIATRFPSYFARHPRKVAWVIHQHRAAYELCGTPSDFDHTEADVGLRRTLLDLDRRMLGECRHVFTNAQNTAQRLEKFNGVAARPAYHPPPLAGRLHPGEYGDYVLPRRPSRGSETRRPGNTRAGLRSCAAAADCRRRWLSTERGRRTAAQAGVADRVVFAGTTLATTLFPVCALAVVYVPFDEDYGHVTLEAFLAMKPVVTASDSGGTLEFVRDGENGSVCVPEPEPIGLAIAQLAGNRNRARELENAAERELSRSRGTE